LGTHDFFQLGTLNNSQDFYQVPKVDNHIHASAMMGARHLLQFIVDKLDYEPDAVVLEREGKSITLAEVKQHTPTTSNTYHKQQTQKTNKNESVCRCSQRRV